MSDPPRLLDGGASPVERELLASWQNAQPSARARANALALAGVAAGAALSVATVSAGAGAATVGTAVGGSSIAPTAAVGTGLAAKWAVGAGALALAAVTGAFGLYYAESRPSSSLVVAPPATTARAPDSRGAAPAPSPSVPTPSPLVSSASMPPGAPDAASSVHAHAESRAHPSALALEIASLERARRALAAGSASTSLSVLDAYDSKFPSGSLREEASVLRVEALAAAGRDADAQRAGARFLTSFPSSPHANRVRAVLAATPRP